MSAQVLIIYSLIGSDSTAHMAEETQQAAVVIPRAMVWSYGIVCLLNFIMLIVVCFCWVEPKAYIDPASGYAFLELFVTATGSARGAIAITSIMIMLIVLSVSEIRAYINSPGTGRSASLG